MRLSWIRIAVLSFVFGFGSQMLLAAACLGAASQFNADRGPFQAVSPTMVYVLGSNNILWQEYPDYRNRTGVSPGIDQFQAMDAADVYVVNGGTLSILTETSPFVFTSNSVVDSTVAQFQALDLNTAYVLGDDGNLWLETRAASFPWTKLQHVDATVAQFQAVDANTVFVEGRDHNLYRESVAGFPNNKQSKVDFPVQRFQALDANTIYVEGMDGNLYLETFSSTFPWTKIAHIDATVARFQAIDASTIYVLGNNGYLNYESRTGFPYNKIRVVGGSVSRFQALDSSQVYVLLGDGFLYLDTGASQSQWLDNSLFGYPPAPAPSPPAPPAPTATHWCLHYMSGHPPGPVKELDHLTYAGYSVEQPSGWAADQFQTYNAVAAGAGQKQADFFKLSSGSCP